MFFRGWRRLLTRKPNTLVEPGAKGRRARQKHSRRFTLEQLEDRTLLSASIPLSGSTWTALGPAPIDVGFSGRLAGVAADPTNANVIYIAAAGGGVWKTTNGGGSWTPLTDNQATLFMGAITIAPSNPNTIYAGTGEATNSGLSFYGRGVLKSTDAGLTWTLLGNTQFNRHTISRIVVDPSSANIVYVAVGGGGVNGVGGNTGIWKSTDGGGTWRNTTTSISTGASFSDLAIDPNDPMHQTLFAAVGSSGGNAANGVYVTTNGGTSWTLAGNFPAGNTNGNMKIAVATTNFPGEHVVYAIIANPATGALLAVEKTTDGGMTWNKVPAPPLMPPNLSGTQGWYDLALTVDPTSSRVVYAAGSAGENSILESRDGGLNWADISGAPHADHHGFAFNANGQLLDINDGGIWRLDNPLPDQIRWDNINGNLNITQFIGIALDPSNANIAYGGSQDNGTSIFNGFFWRESEGGDGGAVLVDPNFPNIVYHGAPIASFGAMNFFRKSTDGGFSWFPAINGLNATDPMNFYQAYAMDPSNSARLVYGTDRVYVSNNGAGNWTPISPHFDINPTTMLGTPINSLAISARDSATIYAADGSHIQVTLTDGVTWFEDDVPGLNHNIAQVLADPSDPMGFVAYAVSDTFNGGSFNSGKGGHVFKTTNAGLSWTDISITLPDLPTYSIALDPRNGRLFVGTDQGVFESPDGGASWVHYMTGLPNVQVRSLELSTRLNILAAGTHGRGMWEIFATPPPVITAATITATEGSVFNGTVATFTETDGDIAFTATINWGDGTPLTTGAITGSNGRFTVSGSHLYTEEGGRVTVTVHDITDSVDASVTSASTVSDPSVVIAGTSGSLSVAEGAGSQSLTLATFTDPAGAEGTGDYTASINWGDNTPATTGMISVASGVFTVTGMHAYAAEGSHNVTITLHHDLAPDVSVTAAVTVTDPSVVAVGGLLLTAAEGDQTSQAVATFTDPGGAELVGNYSASIDWGDGATTAGSITVSSGTFTVNGTAHAYSEEGPYTITVVVNHQTSDPVTVFSSATISDAPLVTPASFTANFVEGTSASNVVATFTDPGGMESLSDYSADINWGSGPTSSGTITFNNGTFAVSGSHNYVEVGTSTVTVTIHHDLAPDVTATNQVVVADAPLTVLGAPLSPVEGAAFSGTIFLFVDANRNATATEFAATIDWGDGTSSTGTITARATGGFNIAGGHRYAEEGNRTISVSITDDGVATTTATSTFTVADAAIVAVPTAGLRPLEGTPFNGIVASLFDNNPAGAASDFTATIDWGDGTTSAGAVALAGIGFNISGSHTYRVGGSYNVNVSVQDKGGSSSSATTKAVVADAALTATPGAPLSGVEASSVSGVVATFTDANPLAQAGDYTVTINWGDGQTSAGTVTGSAATGFQVAGQHLYVESGTYAVNVTIAEGTGNSAKATTSAAVAEAALQGTAATLSSQGLSFTNATVAAFTDPGGLDPATSYSATIGWGDGTAATPGTVVLSGNQFLVLGSHTFAVPGGLSVNVVISEQGGNTISLTGQALLGTQNQRWLARVYVDLLGRQIDPSGLAYWGSLLTQGISRTQIVLGIQSSFEYRAKLVQSWYLKYLGRPADPQGLSGFVQLLGTTTGIGGDNPENFVQLQLISSQEYFFNRGGGTNPGFLQALFHDLVGRDITPSEAATFGLMLAQGATRFQIATLVMSGLEAEQLTVEQDYVRFLRRTVDPTGLQASVSALQHGLEESVLIAGLVASDEYFAKS
jgi:hypothetical protein